MRDPLSRRLRQRLADWLLHDVRLRSAQFGENTVTLCPAGVGDLFRWSGTKDAVASGDMGMDVASGRLSLFVGGFVYRCMASRVMATGTGTLLVPGATTLTTLTRQSGELVYPVCFVTNNVATAAFTSDRTAVIGPAGDAVSIFLQRTVNADEFDVIAQNGNLVTNRNIDWLVFAIR